MKIPKMTQLKNHSELLINLALIINYMAVIAVFVVEPLNRFLWGSLAISFVGLMLLSFRYLPTPQNPHLGGLLPKERRAIIRTINKR
jgi:hypothetical protein